jgi:hypothetical protein
LRVPSTRLDGVDTGWISANSDGTFIVSGLEPGLYQVGFSLPLSCYVAGISEDGRSVTGRRINLASGTRELEIDLRGSAAAVDGVIETGDSEPMSGTALLLSQQTTGEDVRLVVTPISKGNFSFNGIEPGGYILFAVGRYDPQIWADSRFVQQIWSEGQSVRVSGSQRTQIRASALGYEDVLRAAVRAGVTSF